MQRHLLNYDFKSVIDVHTAAHVRRGIAAELAPGKADGAFLKGVDTAAARGGGRRVAGNLAAADAEFAFLDINAAVACGTAAQDSVGEGRRLPDA